MSKKTEQGDKSKGKNDVVYLEGIENSEVETKIQDILDNVDSELEMEAAIDIFIGRANSKYALGNIATVEKRATYAYGIIKSKAKTKRSFSSKPTMLISCVMRSVNSIKNNYTNVTEDTREMKSNDDKVGIAGPWRRCIDCGRKWDTKDLRYGDSCPTCQSMNSVVMANQAVPIGTQGIVNRQETKMGDISGFNKTRSSIFYFNSDSDEIEEAFLSFSGKQQELLKNVQLGMPFDINVQSENIYVNETTGITSFETTGTSKVTDCSIEDFPDILALYKEKEIINAVSDVEDGSYCALFLEVVEEAKQPKDGGRWLVQFSEPVEEEDDEAVVISSYFDDEDIARQFTEFEQGVIECRYSEGEVTVGGKTEISRIINIDVDVCGLPVFILGEDGTKLLSA